jgi:hypothetical protein
MESFGRRTQEMSCLQHHYDTENLQKHAKLWADKNHVLSYSFNLFYRLRLQNTSVANSAVKVYNNWETIFWFVRVCVCGAWTHDKTLNDESLWWSCVLQKKTSVMSNELQSWVPYVHLSKIPTDTSSVKIYYTDHLKQHRWKRSLKYYPVEVLWGQLGKRARNMDPQKGPKFVNRLRRV